MRMSKDTPTHSSLRTSPPSAVSVERVVRELGLELQVLELHVKSRQVNNKLLVSVERITIIKDFGYCLMF